MSDKIGENITLQRIKELKGGDSQEVFAQRIHSTQSNVSKMLKGTPPSASTLRTLAEEYQVSVDWLLGLSDKKELGNVAKTQVINGELLTYADVIVVLDELYKKNSINVGMSYCRYDAEPNSSIIDVNDRVLKYFLDNRMRYVGGSQDIYNIWLELAKKHFAELPVLEWSEENALLYDGNLPDVLSDMEIVHLVDAIANQKLLTHSLKDILNQKELESGKLPFD